MQPGRSLRERGFVLVLVAITSMALFGVVALALGVASWYLDASRIQRAVDAASLAGAAGLPDAMKAQEFATRSLEANGIKDSGKYRIEIDVTNTGVEAQVRLLAASDTFIKSLTPQIGITRSAVAMRDNGYPVMGSPFNVLGTGNLQVGDLPKQNFWLALNGSCQPKEDGDYFNAFFNYNRGPYQPPANGYSPSGQYKEVSGARTRCSTAFAPQTSTYSSNGYSYYVEIPKPPSESGTVNIALFDPTHENNPPLGYSSSIAPDTPVKATADDWPATEMVVTVWDTNNTPEDLSDDVQVPGCPMKAFMYGYYNNQARATGTATPDNWHSICQVPYNRIVKTVTQADGTVVESAGNIFRIQVQDPIPQDLNGYNVPDRSSYVDNAPRGMNAYSVGAFASWIPQAGCDSRTNIYCPKVYSRSSISVGTVGASGISVTPMYFAQVTPGAAGSLLKVYLWDPGENVSKIELWGPGSTPIPNAQASGPGGVPTGTKLTFSWSEVTAQGTQVGGVNPNATEINTSGRKPASEFNQFTTNDFRFNDRLLILTLTVPSNWSEMIASDPALSQWLRLVYYTERQFPDRTTWGISGVVGVSSPPRLAR